MTVRMRRGFAAGALPFAGLTAWSAWMPWFGDLFGNTVSGWDLYDAAGARGLNRLLASDLTWPGSGLSFTGLAVELSAVALGVVALAVLLWPEAEPPATGKIPIWLRVLAGITALAATALPIVNLISFVISRREFVYATLGYGMGIWAMAACFGAVAVAISITPQLRLQPARPPGTPMRRGARITLQITITILLLLGFFVAVGLPCGLEETEAARSACFETTAARVYAGIGVVGAALGILLTWVVPPVRRRLKARHPNP